ncbi:hypothetical protein Tco_0332008 [Tanacetum coccineum]
MVTSSLLSVQLVVVAYKEVMEVLVRCWSDGDVVGATWATTGAAPGIKSIWNSTWRTGGRPVVSSVNRHDKLLTLVGGCFQRLALCFSGKASSIPIVFSWGGSISPNSFLPSILLLLMIIVAVAIVVTVFWLANELQPDKASSVRAFAIVAACASRAAADVDFLLGAILSTFTRQYKIRNENHNNEMIMEKDSKLVRGKREKIKSLALKAKKELSDDEDSTSRSEDEEYAMVVRDFEKFFRR